MPTEVRGRIFGVLASIVSAASLAPTLVAGPLADKVSASLVVGIVGVAVMLVGLWSARWFGPTERGGANGDEPEPAATDVPRAGPTPPNEPPVER